MKFFYGTNEHKYVDITSKVLSECFNKNKIYIPIGDEKRASIFEDPLVGILKNIMIIFNDGISKIFGKQLTSFTA